MKNNIAHKLSLLFLFLLITSITFAQGDSNSQTSFETMLDKLDDAIEEFVNGEHEKFTNFWAHNEDITIAGGFGGPVEKGWTAIEKRLSRVGDAYKKTEFHAERIYSKAIGNLGYLIQHEYFDVFNEDGSPHSTRAYRITMIFEKFDEEWKLVHRHADKNLEWKGLE